MVVNFSAIHSVRILVDAGGQLRAIWVAISILGLVYRPVLEGFVCLGRSFWFGFLVLNLICRVIVYSHGLCLVARLKLKNTTLLVRLIFLK